MKRAALALTLVPAITLAQTPSGHEGHLDISISGSELALNLVVPAADVVGFERPADTDEDRALIAGAISELTKPLELFVPPEEAMCVTVAANVTFSAYNAGSVAGGTENADQPAGNEFVANYQIQCQDIEAIESIRFAYFDHFPQAEKLTVQIDRSGDVQTRDVARNTSDLPL